MENERYIMYFEIKQNDNIIRILGEEFVKNNKNKGKIAYKNKIFSLQGLFPLKKELNDKLKIQILLNKNCYNKSYMFKDCSSLLKIKFYKDIYNNDNLLLGEKDNLYLGFNKNIIFMMVIGGLLKYLL